MSGKKSIPFLRSVLLVLGCTSFLWGQVTTATIVGVAKDETGAVLPSVTVTVRNVETGIVRSATTGARGQYVVSNLIPGNYEVEATLPGFQTTRRSGIVLTVGSERTVDLELRVGATTETITVTAELPVVDRATSTMSGLVDERSIRELPLNARSFETLALLQPGVAQFHFLRESGDRGRGTQFSVAGSRPLQNAFLLDGMDITEFGGATPGSVAGANLGVEAIREFQVLTNTFPAEHGRSPGGIINAVTRSGTNTFHGSVYEFLRNSVLDAKNFFDPHALPIPPFKRNQFGATLGGPIRKDRMFFFANYEGLRSRKGLSNVGVVPSLAARNGVLPDGPVNIAESLRPYLAFYPEPNGADLPGGGALYFNSPTSPLREDYVMGRVDWQLTERDNLFVRYVFNDGIKTVPETLNIFADESVTQRHYFVLGLDRIFSPTVLNVFRAGVNRTDDKLDTEPLFDLNPNLSLVPGEKFGVVEVTGFGRLGTLFTPRRFLTNQFEYADTVHYTRGSHAMKVGANLKRVQNQVLIPNNIRGNYSFVSLRRFLEGVPSNYTIDAVTGFPRNYRQWNVAFFAHDDYRVTPNLTLNLGLRWEFTTDPTETSGRLSNIVNLLTDTEPTLGVGVRPKKKNIEPRMGFAWSPWSSNKTAVRGGVGYFHEHVFPVTYASYLGSMPPYNIRVSVRDNLTFPRTTLGAFADPPQGGPREVDFHVPSKLQYNLNVQHEILPATSLMAGYVGSQSRHLPLAAQMNDRTPTILPDGTHFYPANAPFRNPIFGRLLFACRCGSSTYNGMVLALTRQPRGGFGYQLSYTWSKSIDNASSLAGVETENSATDVMDPDDWNRDRGLSAFNVGHVFVSNFTYDLPTTSRQGPAGVILNGWGLQGIFTAASGTPMYINLGFNQSRSARAATQGQDRPDLVSGRSSNPVLGGPDLYYDPTAFAIPPAGFFGNLGRHTLIGPGRVNFDFSVRKGFPVTEQGRLDFRAEFFNLFNTPQFGAPGRNVFSPGGSVRPDTGKILSTVATSRQIQFALKLTF